MYVVWAVWPKVKSDKEKLELKTVELRSKCIIPRTAHIPTVNQCSRFCVNYSDISWARFTVIISRCCDCRVKIHIRSTGKPTFSRRDSTDDQLSAVTGFSKELKVFTARCFLRSVHMAQDEMIHLPAMQWRDSLKQCTGMSVVQFPFKNHWRAWIL